MKAWRGSRDRNEQIAAIQSFTGYKMEESFASNEYAALTTAKKTLNVLTGTETRKSGVAVVAGVPDMVARKVADLKGREEMSAEKLTGYELTASNLKEGSTEQLTALGMAEIERERLIAIRNDLKLLNR